MKYLIIILLVFSGCTSYEIPASANSGGTILIEAEGMSMAPEYEYYSQHVLKMDWNGLEVGEVALNKHPEYLPEGKLHRVQSPGKRDEEGNVLSWIMRGDANHWNDLYHLWPPYYGGTVIETLN